jgi:hypothetical protein
MEAEISSEISADFNEIPGVISQKTTTTTAEKYLHKWPK